MYTPEPPDYRGGLFFSFVLAIVFSISNNLYKAGTYETVGVSGPVSLCEWDYNKCGNALPYNVNAPYRATWKLTEGITTYASRNERLHL